MKHACHHHLSLLLEDNEAKLAPLLALGPIHQILSEGPKTWASAGLSQQQVDRLFACKALIMACTAPPDSLSLDNAEKAATAFRSLSFQSQEELWVMALDGELKMMATTCVAKGTHNSCYAPIADVLSPVLKVGGKRFLVAHNHPSDDPRPSRDDYLFTRSLEKAARLLNLELIDHLVITRHAWTSCLQGKSGRFPKLFSPEAAQAK